MVAEASVEAAKPIDSDLPRAIQALLAAHCRMTTELQAVRAENADLRAAVRKGLGEDLPSNMDGRNKQGIESRDDSTGPASPACSARSSGESSGGEDDASTHEQRLLALSSAFPLPEAPAATSPQESLFAGAVRRLSVIDEFAVTAELFVHESIIRRLPYFEVRADRWASSDAAELRLPSCCTHLAFRAVLSRLYSLDARWSPADWARVLGEDLSEAYGTLLLLKLLLAADLVLEVAALVRTLASDKASVAWLQRVAAGLDVPELEGFFSSAAESTILDAAALKQAALSAMKGPSEGRQLFQDFLAKREAEGLAGQHAQALLSAFMDYEAYVVRSCSHSLTGATQARRAATHHVATCDFFRPFRIPLESFSWLWQLLCECVQREPALFRSVLPAFQKLQWLEYDVTANRHGQESTMGSRRLRHLPEASSKQCMRRAYASYLLLGLSLLDRGHIEEDAFLEAFSCGAVASPQAADSFFGGRCRNILHFQPSAQRPSSNYVDRLDVIAMVLSSVSADLGASILALVPSFREWQWAFSAVAVASLSDGQQAACARGSTLRWLSDKVLTVLRGEARSIACERLMSHIGVLTSGQRSFVLTNLVGAT